MYYFNAEFNLNLRQLPKLFINTLLEISVFALAWIQLSEWIGVVLIGSEWIQIRLSWFFAAFCNNRQNLNLPLYTTNETADKTVDWTKKIGSEEGEKRSIRWEGDCVRFMGRERNRPHSLSWGRENHQPRTLVSRRVLYENFQWSIQNLLMYSIFWSN